MNFPSAFFSLFIVLKTSFFGCLLSIFFSVLSSLWNYKVLNGYWQLMKCIVEKFSSDVFFVLIVSFVVRLFAWIWLSVILNPCCLYSIDFSSFKDLSIFLLYLLQSWHLRLKIKQWLMLQWVHSAAVNCGRITLNVGFALRQRTSFNSCFHANKQLCAFYASNTLLSVAFYSLTFIISQCYTINICILNYVLVSSCM